MTGAPVVPVFCHMERQGRYHIEFRPPFDVPPDTIHAGQAQRWVQRFLNLLEDQVRLYPSNSNEYFFWPQGESDHRAA
jgi:KDO2-lipid IV(A) lauroyltransferase